MKGTDSRTRCLIKMQKQGKSNCPMCRSPCVLTADRSEYFRSRSKLEIFPVPPHNLSPPANVDWALMNFMADWFPVESREKMESNEREANAELARELGFDKNGCLIT